MSANVRVQINRAGFNAIRNSDEVTGLLEDLGAQIAATANSFSRYYDEPDEPFDTDTVHNQSRAVVFVRTNNFDGVLAEAHDRALTRAIG